MKFSVSTYSFWKLIEKGEMTQLDCLSKAKEMGFDAVEIEGIHSHDGSSMEEYAEKLANEAKRVNLPISNFVFGADFLNGSEGNTSAEIERVKGMLDIAEILGTKYVRHDVTSGYPKGKATWKTFDTVLPVLADACRKVTEYAATKGIHTMVENHAYFCQDSERVEKLVSTVANNNFGLLADMGNFLCVDENPADAFSRVAPHAFYVHAKDFLFKGAEQPNPGEGFFRTRSGNYLRGTIIGQGCVPVVHCLQALKQAEFDGTIAIEFEGLEEPIEAIAIGLTNLKRYMNQVYGE